MHRPTSAAADSARRFVDARRRASALRDYPGQIPETLAEAYAIQELAIDLYGQPVGGWKVGRILGDNVARFGVDRFAGPIFVPSIVTAAPDRVGCIFREGFGAVEAEFLFRIGTPPPAGQVDFTLEEAARYVDAVHIGIEIASSPFPGINILGPAVTVSDFGNNNGLIVGPPIVDWKSGDFADIDISSSIDGDVRGTGRACAFPDGPMGSVRFLLENLARRALPITAGQWVSTGAVTGVHQVSIGQMVRADFGSLGVVECAIGMQDAQ
jgi:2-keto-4-pentenoate hydratase